MRKLFDHHDSSSLCHSKTLTAMKWYIPFVFRSSVPEFLLVNSVVRWFIIAAGFEGTFLSSFLYLLTRTLTIFSSDGIGAVVIYLDFHLTKRALWLVGSWSLVPDQIQMYPDQDTIAQLLPLRRIRQHVISAWINKKWRDLQHMLTSAWLLNFTPQ